MRGLEKLRLRGRSLFRRGRVERELEEELRFHLDEQIAENLAAGMDAEEARYAARRAVGGAEQIKEECRDMRGVQFVQDLVRDVRYALRVLRKSPGFTTVAVLSLTLGIGLNTAVFSIISAVMLRRLPVKNPEQLVVFSHRYDFSYPMYVDLRDHNDVLSGLLCRFTIPASMSVAGETERISAELVSGNYFQVLGVEALIGRTLTPDDARTPGAEPVVVLGNRFWRRRFGSDPSIVGKTVRVDGHPMTVVGVTPAGFEGTEVGVAPDVRVPVTMCRAVFPDLSASDMETEGSTDIDMNARGWGWLDLIGRLKDGVSRTRAEAALNAMYLHARQTELQTVFQDFPADTKARMLAERIALEPGDRGVSDIRDAFSHQLWILMFGVGIVLIIACTNVASLLLAKAAARRREIAVRMALGAGRARVVRQLITESVLLVMIAGPASLLIAHWGGKILISFLPEERLPVVLNVQPDLRVLGFTLMVSLFAAILFGLAPAMQLARCAFSPALKVQGNWAGVRDALSYRRILTAAQVALCVLLLEGAGLFVSTVRNLKAVDLGYDRENTLLMQLVPTLNGYNQDQSRRFFEEVIERVNRLPGVRAASIGSMGLLGRDLTIQGVRAGTQQGPGWINTVSTRYFETLGIPIWHGRSFTADDANRSKRVAIVNQTLARRFFGDGNPIGRQFGVGGDNDIEIVGVVRDGKYKDPREKTPNVVYLPFEQSSIQATTLFVRTVGDPGKAAAGLRREIAAVDRNVPVYHVRTLESQFDESLSQERLLATLSAWFGAFALLLAAIGLYGALAYGVARRTNEIGIRMALGAEQGTVIWMVLREAGLLVGAGIVAGAPVALALSRSVSSLLYGVKPTSIGIISAVTALLLVVATLASYLPARRASRVDPMDALRHE